MSPTLRGKTLFITGASRGIGKAIAIRAARDGANVAVVAKTAAPDPRLPGTIYSAAEEIEAAGGRALPLVVDVREESQVQAAVERCVEHFGGIDILINNASAIALTRTPETSMKRYDLMMDINVRGTFLCSRLCHPHLSRSSNPHILTLSPPLDLQRKWFAPHAAYTTSKFAMSLLAHGMAAELAVDGIAVNALWPRTLIATAALNVANEGGRERARKPQIMADAAHWILTRDSRNCSGNFFIDECVLRAAGVTDFAAYLLTPGVEPLIDLFVEEAAAGPNTTRQGSAPAAVGS
ncbi:MAG TPA: NAD(P)-dependent oxidoreductase [Steroidobacter sp.]|uniref:SDR family oxidoreductase n=1 Tax=Steroidobacter sp. TaxID=1978227 RepID=UPI002ED8EC9E